MKIQAYGDGVQKSRQAEFPGCAQAVIVDAMIVAVWLPNKVKATLNLRLQERLASPSVWPLISAHDKRLPRQRFVASFALPVLRRLVGEQPLAPMRRQPEHVVHLDEPPEHFLAVEFSSPPLLQGSTSRRWLLRLRKPFSFSLLLQLLCRRGFVEAPSLVILQR